MEQNVGLCECLSPLFIWLANKDGTVVTFLILPLFSKYRWGIKFIERGEEDGPDG